MKVTFIGLGKMGHPMARNLLTAGIPLALWNRTPSRGDDLVSAGATRPATAAEAANADVILTMVSDDAALADVLFTEQLIEHLRPGAIHLSMSTISVALAERLASEHK